jgi:uncharacterized membrane protein YeiB
MMIAHYVPFVDPSWRPGAYLADTTLAQDVAFGLPAGRASALFVVLGGVGLTLLFAGGRSGSVVVRRAVVLGALGLLLLPDFGGMILHLFAVWFLAAIAFRRASDRTLLVTAAALVPLGWLGAELLGGTHWLQAANAGEAFTNATEFWTNLAFTHGAYPAVPWFSLVLLGMWLGRRALTRRPIQLRLLLAGAAAAICLPLLGRLAPEEGRLASFASAEPHTTGLPSMLGAAGSAVAVIGGCLLLTSLVPRVLAPLAAAGRLSLTLYVAHLVPFWLWFEAEWARYDGHPGPSAVLAPLAFFACFTAVAWAWVGRFERGPLETLLRRASDARPQRPPVRFRRAGPARDRLHDLPA